MQNVRCVSPILLIVYLIKRSQLWFKNRLFHGILSVHSSNIHMHVLMHAHTHTYTHSIRLFYFIIGNGIISVWWQNLLASIFAFISQYGNRFVHNGEITIKRYKWTIGDKCEHWTLQQPKSIPISGNYNRKLNIIISLISVLCLFFNRR